MDNGQEQVKFLTRMRTAVMSLWEGSNNIERLMKDKIDDYHLIEEIPACIKIGEKHLWIGCLTLENLYKFVDGIAKIMANIGLQTSIFDTMANSDEMIKALMIHRSLQKDLAKLICSTFLKQNAYYMREVGIEKVIKMKLPVVSYRYFKKKITMEKLVQIMHLVYLYNFDAVKKNFKILAEKMDCRALTETYIYTWLRNSDGLSGAFVKPQFPISDLSASEDLNEITNPSEKVS